MATNNARGKAMKVKAADPPSPPHPTPYLGEGHNKKPVPDANARLERDAPLPDADELAAALRRTNLDDDSAVREIRLFCANCGKEQQSWDVDGKRAKPIKEATGNAKAASTSDPQAKANGDSKPSDGFKRTKGGRPLYNAQESTCDHCGHMILCNPLSAVCTHCDAIMSRFRPTYWKCTNTDGKAKRRDDVNKKDPVVMEPSDAQCKYARTCHECKNYDERYRSRPNCRCPFLHGAIAGQIHSGGNCKVDGETGHVGWVMVH